MTNYQPESSEPQSTSFESSPPATPRKRRLGTKGISAIVVVVLLGVLGVGAAVVLPTLFQAQQNIPKLLGGDTQFYASINPNLSAVPGLRNIQRAYQGLTDSSDDASEDLNQQLADRFGLSFKDDIQPWLGTEIGVGVSGIQTIDTESVDEALANEAKVVFVLASTDNAKANAFLEKLRTQQAAEGAYTEETYKNVQINGRPREPEGENFINAMATVQDYVVIASDVDVLKAVIDRSGAPQNTLNDKPQYQAVMAGLPKSAIGYVFVDGAPISGAIEQMLEEVEAEQRQQLEKSVQNFRAMEGFGASISIVDQGLSFDTDVKFDVNKLDAATKDQLAAAKPGVGAGIMSTVAQQALGMFTGNIPPTTKQQVLDFLNSSPDAQEQRQQFEEQFDFNLERDLLDWLQGDVAVVVLPADRTQGLGLPATGYLALRTPNKTAATDGLKKLEGVAEQMGGAAFSDESFGGQQWRVMESGDQTVLGYAVIGEDLVIGVGESALTVIPTGAQQPLVADPNFKAVQANLPAPNGGIGFLNVPEIVKAVAAFQGQTPEEFYNSETGKSLQPIRGVGFAGVPGIDATGLAKAKMFVLISDSGATAATPGQ